MKCERGRTCEYKMQTMGETRDRTDTGHRVGGDQGQLTQHRLTVFRK